MTFRGHGESTALLGGVAARVLAALIVGG